MERAAASLRRVDGARARSVSAPTCGTKRPEKVRARCSAPLSRCSPHPAVPLPQPHAPLFTLLLSKQLLSEQLSVSEDFLHQGPPVSRVPVKSGRNRKGFRVISASWLVPGHAFYSWRETLWTSWTTWPRCTSSTRLQATFPRPKWRSPSRAGKKCPRGGTRVH